MRETAKGRAGIDAAAMQVALAVLQEPQALGERRRAQRQLDAGQRLAVSGDRRGDDRLHPHRIRGDLEAAGAAGDRRLDLRFRGLDLPENVTGAFGGHDPEQGKPDARRQAFEELSAEPDLEPGNDTAERRLGDGEPFGGGEDAAGFRDRDEFDQVAAPVEHDAVFRFQFIECVSSRSASGLSASPGPILFFNPSTGFFRCPAIPW